MFKNIALCLLLASLASASGINGVVSGVVNCGSAGRLISLEITDCDEVPCLVIIGNSYKTIVTFAPSASTNQLSYKVTAFAAGFEVVLVDLPVPGDVSEGQDYSLIHAKLAYTSLRPDFNIETRFEIWDNATGLRQICASAETLLTE